MIKQYLVQVSQEEDIWMASVYERQVTGPATLVAMAAGESEGDAIHDAVNEAFFS